MSWKVTAILVAVVLIVSWAITAELTKLAFTDGPAPVPTGGGCDNYDPVPLGKALYNDLNCSWCTRTDDIYLQLLALADCQFISVYNYYSKKYGISLRQNIAGQSTWTSFDNTFTNTLQPQCEDRFKTLGLQ